MSGGEAPSGRDDEHVASFHCESFGEGKKKHFFWSSMRLNKASDAQTGTAKAWTVGLLMTVNVWSRASAIHITITLTRESCGSVMCDGCIDIN